MLPLVGWFWSLNAQGILEEEKRKVGVRSRRDGRMWRYRLSETETRWMAVALSNKCLWKVSNHGNLNYHATEHNN